MKTGIKTRYLISHSDLVMKKFSTFTLHTRYKIVLFSVLFLIVFLVTSNVEALDDKSRKVTWQLIFISPYSGCTNYQYQMTNFYDEVTTKYFEVYKFPNVKYQPTCMPDAKYSKYQVPKDVDLLILVYDYEIGRKDLNKNDLGGVYVHTGDDRLKNHTIVLCDCSNFRFSDPVWILSHELSHFILYYLGYDKTVVEDKVHAMDQKYDRCVEVQYDKSCSNVKIHLKGDYYFSYVTVMAPYYPAIGKDLVLVKDEKVSVSPHVVDIEREVTKWWLDGKINDTEYAKVLGYSVDEQSGIIKTENYSSADQAIVFPDGPEGKEINETYHDITKVWDKKEVSTIFARVPDKIIKDNSFPDWFKARAQWWIQGKIWNDTEFLSGAKYLLSGNSTVK